MKILNHDDQTQHIEYTIQVGEHDLYFMLDANGEFDECGLMYTDNGKERVYRFYSDAAREMWLPYQGSMRSVYQIYELTSGDAMDAKRALDEDARRERKSWDRHVEGLRVL